MRRIKRTASGKASSKDADKVEALFNKYRDAGEEDAIGPEGVERLCRDMGLDPNDRRVLLLAWRMGAKRMGYFARDEFLQGLTGLKVHTVDKLKKALPGVEEEVAADPDAFQDFYMFAFRFCLTEPRQKFIDIDTAVQMLGICMPQEPHLPRFTAFLAEQKEYKVINADQWTGFLRFTQEVLPDLSNYDESQAWPLLLDNFVDWSKGGPGHSAAS